MTRRLFSALFLIDSLIIGLGGFGHAYQWSSHVSGALGSVDAHITTLLQSIWYWVSGTMLVFGLLLVWCWHKLSRGDASLVVIPWMTGGFYILAGTCVALSGAPFFWLFPVLGALLWLCTWMLRAGT